MKLEVSISVSRNLYSNLRMVIVKFSLIIFTRFKNLSDFILNLLKRNNKIAYFFISTYIVYFKNLFCILYKTLNSIKNDLLEIYVF